jgi:hypothetical protein
LADGWDEEEFEELTRKYFQRRGETCCRFYERQNNSWNNLHRTCCGCMCPRDVSLDEDQVRFKKQSAAHIMVIINNLVIALIAKSNFLFTSSARRYFAAYIPTPPSISYFEKARMLYKQYEKNRKLC